MGDIVLVTMIQTEVPSEQVGKVYSVNMIIESAGLSIGLLLAVPLYAYLNVPIVIGLCAVVMMGAGVVGLLKFGFEEPVMFITGPLPVSTVSTITQQENPERPSR